MADEFARIARYLAPLAGPEGRGLADDAAVLIPPPGRELVLTVDQMLEGVHFLATDPPDLIAQKLLRRNLSDLAAMGAAPLGYLLTIALPPQTAEFWLAEFAEGLARDQEIFNIKLFGGDSSSSLTHTSLSATLIGHVAPGAAISRNGAQPGDDIWVTGTIGDAALGLQARLGKLVDPTGHFTNRSLLPSPRIGLNLAGIVNAAIDISDGLLQDLGHMCDGANLAAIIHAARIPISQDAEIYAAAMQEIMLTDGDDYELLLAVPPSRANDFIRACDGLRITKIGKFSIGKPAVKVLDQTDRKINFTKTGWRHF